jgi:hypothetical protein
MYDMFGGIVKQGTRSRGKHKPFVSFEVLLSNHKAIEVEQTYFLFVFLH